MSTPVFSAGGRFAKPTPLPCPTAVADAKGRRALWAVGQGQLGAVFPWDFVPDGEPPARGRCAPVGRRTRAGRRDQGVGSIQVRSTRPKSRRAKPREIFLPRKPFVKGWRKRFVLLYRSNKARGSLLGLWVLVCQAKM